MSRIVATIVGNAVANAEKRTINSNGQPRTVATFRVAINRGTGDNRQTDYVRVSVWGQAADRLNIEKGDMVTVFTNDLHINSYTGQQDGQTHFNLECTSNWVEVGANKPRPDQGQAQGQTQGQVQGQYNGYAGQQAQGQYNGYAAQGQQAQGQYNGYAGQAQPAQAQGQYNGYAAQGQPAQAQGQYNGYAGQGQQAQGQYNSYAGQAQPAQAQPQVQPQAQPASGFLDMPAGIDGELPFR